MPDRIAHYARQRRQIALMMSAMWVVYGILVILTVDVAATLFSWMPHGTTDPHISGMFFVVIGIVAAVLAYEADERRHFEGWSYGVLTAGPVLAAVFSMLGAALEYIPNGWASGFRFLMFAVMSFHLAGLRPSNTEIRKAPPG